MPIPWTDSIKRGGVLHVHAASSIGHGAWRAVFNQAIREFNRLSGAKALGVTLQTARHASDAEVIVEAQSRSIDQTYDGARIQHSFSGTTLHGYTAQASREGHIEKAFVFLPSTPQVNTPRGLREVGAGVKLVIAVHEFVHACGLSNGDHSTDDLFMGYPTVDAGSRPEQDRVRVTYSVIMPPLVLATGTVSKIRQIWG